MDNLLHKKMIVPVNKYREFFTNEVEEMNNPYVLTDKKAKQVNAKRKKYYDFSMDNSW